MKITDETIDKIRDGIGGLVNDYREDIAIAIADGDDSASISFPVKMVKRGTDLVVQVGINFVKTRVKDGILFTVSDQRELFGEDV